MNKIEQATALVEQYFQATYHGDAEAMHAVFHPKASVNGFINSTLHCWDVAGFVSQVVNGESAAEQGQRYDKKIIAVDINNNIAMVKAINLVGETYFTDQINLIWSDGNWLIISKVFTD